MAFTADDLKYLKGIEKKLEDLAQAHSKVSPGQVFGGVYAPTKGQHRWDEKVIERLAKSYDPSAVSLLTSGSRPKALGWGSDLVHVAGSLVDNLGIKTSPEEVEKRGWLSVAKAANQGIKMPNGEVRKTSLAEGSGMTGGYLIPPQYQAELLTIAAEDAFIEPRAKVVPMNSRTMSWPFLDITTAQTAGTSPYFGGVLATWQPEAASISETEPQFRMADWTAWDLVLYSVSSNQLLLDNGIGLDALLTQLFAQGLTWYKEYAYLRGTGAGSSMPLGILNANAAYVQNRGTGSHFKLVDVATMMSHLQVRSYKSACWVMHPSVIADLIQMTSAAAGADRLIWLRWDEGLGDQKIPTALFNGMPIYFTEKVPTLGTKGDVMLIDWSQYVIGNRLDYQIDVSKDYLFRNNQLAWRVIGRSDGKPWLNNTITDASGWVSSPFVILN